MHAHRDPVVVADRPQRVPVARVDGGEPEPGRDLGERDGAHAALGVAPGLGRGRLGVPQRDEAQRDVVTRRRGAPLLDHPVVVGPHTGQAQLLVGVLVEGLPAKAREGREGQRAVGVVEGQVLDPLVALEAARAHLVVGGGRHGHQGAVEDEVAFVVLCDRGPGDGHELLLDIDELVVVVPGVAPLAVLVLVHVVFRPREVLEGTPALALDRGPRARHFSGSQVCHTCGGSTTWSSTLMIRGSAMARG